jgi:hypothetical protein
MSFPHLGGVLKLGFTSSFVPISLSLHDKDLLDASCSGSFKRMKEEAKWDS